MSRHNVISSLGDYVSLYFSIYTLVIILIPKDFTIFGRKLPFSAQIRSIPCTKVQYALRTVHLMRDTANFASAVMETFVTKPSCSAGVSAVSATPSLVPLL